MATKVIYRDFNPNFIANPATGDIGAYTDEMAVNQSIKNLVLTNKYERLFDGDKAGGIKELLFELPGPQTESLIKRRIRDVIESYEPRAELIDIYVNFIDTKNAYDIAIKYYMISSTVPIEFKFLAKRLI